MTDPSPAAVPPSSVPVAWPTEWPVDVRRIADATVDALAAVVAQDPIAFDEAAYLRRWYGVCSKRYTAMA